MTELEDITGEDGVRLLRGEDLAILEGADSNGVGNGDIPHIHVVGVNVGTYIWKNLSDLKHYKKKEEVTIVSHALEAAVEELNFPSAISEMGAIGGGGHPKAIGAFQDVGVVECYVGGYRTQESKSWRIVDCNPLHQRVLF